MKYRGLTLIECLVSIFILSIFTVCTLPIIEKYVHLKYMEGEAEKFISSVIATRTEAVNQQRNVAMCKGSPKIGCIRNNSWNEGWILFVDSNNNSQFDNGDKVFQSVSSIRTGYTYHSSAGVSDLISFTANGYMNSSGSISIIVCSFDKSVSLGYRINLSMSGRLTSEKDLSACDRSVPVAAI